MLSKTKAIVLHSIKYGDSGLIVRVFTQEYGREALIVQGVRKKRSRFNPYLFEPFSLVNLDFYYKSSANLHRLKEIHSDIHLHQLHFDVKRSTIAIFLSELLLKTLPDSEANDSLFNYIYHSIQILDIAEKGVEYFHLLFLLQYSKFLGIYPENNSNISNYRTPGNIQLSDLFSYSLTDLDKLEINPQNRKLLLDIILKYYRDHHDGIGDLKSLEVLREVFN